VVSCNQYYRWERSMLLATVLLIVFVVILLVLTGLL